MESQQDEMQDFEFIAIAQKYQNNTIYLII